MFPFKKIFVSQEYVQHMLHMLTSSSGWGLFHQGPVFRSNYYVPGEIVPMKDCSSSKKLLSYIKMKTHSDNPGNLIFVVDYSTKNW